MLQGALFLTEVCTVAKARSKADRSGQRSPTAPPSRRKPASKSGPHAWRWVVDNRMRDFGEIDFGRRVIRINHAMHKREGELLIDTLFHEELHRLFPRLGEWAICLMTKSLLPTLSRRYKAGLYARIRAR
jgi:hypothetical protein